MKPDIWDDVNVSHRGAKRYRTRWKVALVFSGGTGKPTLKTMTYDLSTNGMSVQGPAEEPTQTPAIVLLRQPPNQDAGQKVIKLKAVIASCIPFRGSFRLGLSFIQDEGLDELQRALEQYDLSSDSLPSDPEADALPSLDIDLD
jgi:hypothetical protein